LRHFVLWFTKITGALPMLLFIRPKVCREGKRPSGKGAVVVMNHTAMLDFATVLLLFPARTVRVLMAEVLFRKGKLLSWFLRGMRGIMVERNGAEGADFLGEAARAIEKGDAVGVFPEGKLNPGGRDFGKLLPFKPGAAYIALTTGAPVIANYCDGAYSWRRRTRVMQGEPIALRERFPGAIDEERIGRATAFLELEVARLKRELSRRVEAERRDRRTLLDRYIRGHIGRMMALGFRPRYYYSDKAAQGRVLPPGSIVISNHTDFFDPPMLCTAFRKNLVRMVAGEALYRRPALKWLLDRLSCIPIDREAVDVRAFREMLRVLERGDCVGIFPEGEMSKGGGIGPFRAGLLLVAAKSGAPIVMAYIGRPYRALRKRQAIWIDTPVRFSGELTAENLEKNAEMLRERMLQLKARLDEEEGRR